MAESEDQEASSSTSQVLTVRSVVFDRRGVEYQTVSVLSNLFGSF